MIISVVIPVFNERDTILEIIKRVKQTSLAQEIIVLDDGSTDGTTEILKELKPSKEIHAYFHNENLGKGIAVRNSINHAKGNVIIIQDSDLEYNPCDFPILLKPIQDGLADVVYGSRFLSKRGQQLIFWSLAANKILTFFTNMLYHSKLSDMETGYKVFKKDIFNRLSMRANGFDFEPEFTAKILKRGIRIIEVPISFHPRDYSEGKKIRLKDAIIALWTLIKYRFVN